MASLNQQSNRNINIEFLRILLIFMALFGHRVGHGCVYEISLSGINNVNYFIYITFFSFIVTVSMFYMISGYFLINSKPKTKRVYSVWRTVFFYSVLLFFVSIFLRFFVNNGYLKTFGLNPGRFKSYFLPNWNDTFADISNFTDWINAFFPVCRSAYGFFSCYCVLYLLTPFLNKFLKALTKKQYQYLLILTSLFVSILPTVFYSDFIKTSSTSGIVWAIYIYMVAGYLRLHFDIYSIKRRNYLITFFTMIFIKIISFIILDNTAFHNGKARNIWREYFNGRNNIILVIAVVCLFCYFLTKECKPKKTDGLVLTLSSCVFGIYLIHDNLCTRIFMWDILLTERVAGTKYIWPAVLIDIAIVFIFCAAFDLLRQKLFKKWDEVSANFKIIKKRDEFFSRIDSIFD